MRVVIAAWAEWYPDASCNSVLSHTKALVNVAGKAGAGSLHPSTNWLQIPLSSGNLHHRLPDIRLSCMSKRLIPDLKAGRRVLRCRSAVFHAIKLWLIIWSAPVIDVCRYIYLRLTWCCATSLQSMMARAPRAAGRGPHPLLGIAVTGAGMATLPTAGCSFTATGV